MNLDKRLLWLINLQDLEDKLTSFSTIGDRLRYLRKTQLGISRKELSNLIGITQNMLNKYENNYFEPKLDRLKLFSDFYNVPLEFLTEYYTNKISIDEYFLISNINVFCSEIDNGLISVSNIDEIEKCVHSASSYVLLEFLNTNLHINNDILSKILNTNQDNLLHQSFLETHIENSTDTYQDKKSLSKLFESIMYFVCIRDELSKSQYKQVLIKLSPLVECYKNYLEKLL